ncbi:MAG: nucleoside monophosphate kinase [Alphaproteobacteria bacterium]|nr:nucleoside monophosphate kinase [Alphaproteobacteria bacterium]
MRNLIIVIGPPGSGKTLASNLITQKRGATKISTGDILRKMVNDKELSEEVSMQISQGDLICDDIVNAIVEKELSIATADIVLDGYPRNFSQFVNLQQIVGKSFNICCVFMKTPSDLILKRINQRVICSLCGKSHTSKEDSCTSCGGSLIKRPDDANILNRLNSYFKITEPVFTDALRYWCNKNITVEISIESDLHQITKEVETQLKQLLT